MQSKHSMEVLANVLKEAITLKTMGEKVAVLAYCKRNRHGVWMADCIGYAGVVG